MMMRRRRIDLALGEGFVSGGQNGLALVSICINLLEFGAPFCWKSY